MCRIYRTHLIILSIITLSIGLSPGLIPYGDTPDWESDETGFNDVTTGGNLTDFNGDGWLDLSCGNGNDINQDENCIYFNNSGTLEEVASWRSDNLAYSGHIICGDLDKNGWVDLVVANYAGSVQGNWDPVEDDIYFNSGGTLETTPSWSSNSEDYSFSTTLIDYDGDGDLDVATANGERYNSHPGPVKIFRNDDGVISTTPTWQSDNNYYTYDLCAGDINDDGWLDLICACDGDPNILFLNTGGTLSTTPDWSSTESRGSLRCVLGDIDGNGYLDFVVADNEQMSSVDSKVRIYFNSGGNLENTASWVSAENYKDYYSCVALGDVDYDGDLDLAAGGWWEPLEVYENNSGTLEVSPDWQWITSPANNLVCEEIVLGDVDRDGEITDIEYLSGDGSSHTYQLSHQPFKSINSITVDSTTLPTSDYCYLPVDGWISFKNPPPTGVDNIEVDYTYSSSLDIIVTNWHGLRGNFLFYYRDDIPVILFYFNSRYSNGDIIFEWDVDNIDKYDGFNLYRKKDNILNNTKTPILERLNEELITGKCPYSFTYEVDELDISTTYYLKIVTESEEDLIGATNLILDGKIPYFEIITAFPNPFSDAITISYNILTKSSKNLTISIYDIAGRLISKEMVIRDTGCFSYTWDCSENQSISTPDGIYICIFDVDGAKYPIKLVKMR